MSRRPHASFRKGPAICRSPIPDDVLDDLKLGLRLVLRMDGEAIASTGSRGLRPRNEADTPGKRHNGVATLKGSKQVHRAASTPAGSGEL